MKPSMTNTGNDLIESADGCTCFWVVIIGLAIFWSIVIMGVIVLIHVL